MELLNWNSEYLVDVAEMDDQHKRLFKLLNDFYRAATNQEFSTAKAALSTFLESVAAHFEAEEELLSATRYPELSHHHDAHLDLTILACEYISRFERGELRAETELIKFLRIWLIYHIQNEDQKYGTWVTQYRLSHHS